MGSIICPIVFKGSLYFSFDVHSKERTITDLVDQLRLRGIMFDCNGILWLPEVLVSQSLKQGKGQG